MEDIIRIGTISAVRADTGTAQVYYPDRGSTTAPLNLFAFNGEYRVPAVGEQVVVLHLPNDTSSGVILGRFWGGKDVPAPVEYRKDTGQGAYEELSNGVYLIHGPEVRLESMSGSMTVMDFMNLCERVRRLEARGDGE